MLKSFVVLSICTCLLQVIFACRSSNSGQLQSNLEPTPKESSPNEEVSLAIDADNFRETLTRKMYGVNWEGSTGTTSNLKSTFARYSEIGIGSVRFPGGWFGEHYDYFTNAYHDAFDALGPWGGVDADTFLNALPADIEPRFIIRTLPSYYGSDTVLAEEVLYAVAVVNKYANKVKTWDLGNEYYLFGPKGNPNNPIKYARVAKAMIPALKSAQPQIEIFLQVDWVKPQDVEILRRELGESVWSMVTGLSPHIYSGDTDPEHRAENISINIALMQKYAGRKMKIWSSEWNASRAWSGEKEGLAGASVMMQVFDRLVKDQLVDIADIWAYSSPPINLVNWNAKEFKPRGLAYQMLAQYYLGHRLEVEGNLQGTYVMASLTEAPSQHLHVFVLARESLARLINIDIKNFRWNQGRSTILSNFEAPFAETVPKVTEGKIVGKMIDNTTRRTSIPLPKQGNEGGGWDIIHLEFFPQ